MSLPLKRWTFSLDADGRVERIDSLLKEKLSPSFKGRSERIRWLYELGFAVACGDRTNEIVRSLFLSWQQANGVNYSYFPALPTPQTGSAGEPIVSSVKARPLEFRASRPFRAVLVQEAVEAAFLPSFLHRTHAAGRVA
jgi:hypothetical protein